MNNIINNEKHIIAPVNDWMKEKYQEPEYEDFITREEFINRTGIMVSPRHFDFIYDVEYKGSGLSAEEFVSTYEERFGFDVEELPLEGTLKYFLMDEDISRMGCFAEEDYQPNIYDIVYGLVSSEESERIERGKLYLKYNENLKKMSDVQEKYKQDKKKISQITGEVLVEMIRLHQSLL